MAAMLEEPHNKRYLHKIKIYFLKENLSIVSLIQNGFHENTLYEKYSRNNRTSYIIKRASHTLIGNEGEYQCDMLNTLGEITFQKL